MTVSESPSSSEFRFALPVLWLCTLESLSLFFDFCFVFFFSFHFLITVRFGRSEPEENKQIIREILDDESKRHRGIYSKFFLRSER